MNVKLFRLVSGEEIMGELKNLEGSSKLEIKNPAMIIMQQSGQGVAMGLMPFMPYAESNLVTFQADKIVAECEADVKLINEYNRIFGSGIQIANSLPR